MVFYNDKLKLVSFPKAFKAIGLSPRMSTFEKSTNNMENYIKLVSPEGRLNIDLCSPGTYYQGTRFDWSGVFRRIIFDEVMYADEWFEGKTEFSHDHVCGPSEEFAGSVGYDEAGREGLFLKIGVGLLERDSCEAYDAFHLYKIADGGEWTVRHDSHCATFKQELARQYGYEKTIRISDEDSFEIMHKLTNTGSKILSTSNYCHNFFNIAGKATGPESSIELDFHPEGKWRENAICGYVSGNSFRFDGMMPAGRNTYLGEIYPPAGKEGYDVTINGLNGKRKVVISCDRPASMWVFWANSRVATPEPYIRLEAEPGQTLEWTTTYRLI